jgi:hypothetical protein
MKNNVLIFVEGEADVKFLSDCITEWFGVDKSQYSFKNLEGIDNLYLSDQDMRANSAKEFGGNNIVIIDADFPATNGGYNQRCEEIYAFRVEQNLLFDFFLLPNHKDDGDLEILLEKCINEKNRTVLDCWESYEECLDKKGGYTLPARKSKMYGYVEALVGTTKSEKKKIKEPFRDYRNKEHWDLNSESLQSLRQFLTGYFS